MRPGVFPDRIDAGILKPKPRIWYQNQVSELHTLVGRNIQSQFHFVQTSKPFAFTAQPAIGASALWGEAGRGRGAGRAQAGPLTHRAGCAAGCPRGLDMRCTRPHLARPARQRSARSARKADGKARVWSMPPCNNVSSPMRFKQIYATCQEKIGFCGTEASIRVWRI